MFPIDNSQLSVGKNFQNTTQWPLNPSAYQNVANENVDWAALAKQWIQMKEICPSDQVPPAPPPPRFTTSIESTTLSKNSNVRNDFEQFEEQGEAPMEVERDEDNQINTAEQTISPSGSPTNSTTAGQWNPNWNNFRSQTQWRVKNITSGWNSWTNPNMVPPPSQSINIAGRQSLLPDPFSNAGVSRIPINDNVELSLATTWQNNSNKTRFNSLQPTESLILKPTIATTATPTEISHVSTTSAKTDLPFVQEDTTATIDAAKRKNLPAWIREGLEKMEREKQKQAEREKEQLERLTMLEQKRIAEEEALKELEAIAPSIPKRSKFDSDSESGSEEVEENKKAIVLNTSSPPIVKSREKSMQDLMLDVRRVLTEILLEVTNEEILEIAIETMNKARKKAPITQNLSKIGPSTLTAKLGLNIYTNSESETSDTEEDTKESNDSDLELQETIKRRIAAFKKTSKEIELKLAEEEEREEIKRKESEQKLNEKNKSSHSEGTSTQIHGNGKVSTNHDKLRDGETQPLDKNYSRSGHSTREKKTSRFSDPKDTVRNTHLTHVSIVSSSSKKDKDEKVFDKESGGWGDNSNYYHSRSSEKNDNTSTVRIGKRSRRSRSTSTSSTSSSTNDSSATSPSSSNRRSSHKKSRRKKTKKSKESKYDSSSNNDDDVEENIDNNDSDLSSDDKRSYKCSVDKSRSSHNRSRSSSREKRSSRHRRHHYNRSESRDYRRQSSNDQSSRHKSKSRDSYSTHGNHSKGHSNYRRDSKTKSRSRERSSRHRY